MRTLLLECVGKQPYRRWLDASRADQAMRCRRGGARRKRINIYRCQYCRAWHMGSEFIGRRY